MALQKHYISAQQLLDDSFELGLKVLESGFHPDFIVGIWRGGAPVGIAIQELFEYFGMATDHIAIRTSLYTGIDKTAEQVKVHGLGYLFDNAAADSGILLVDDVFDSGRSVNQVCSDLLDRGLGRDGALRIATPYFKPTNNQTQRVPDYFLKKTADWLVFPHELCGLELEELLERKPGIASILTALEREAIQ